MLATLVHKLISSILSHLFNDYAPCEYKMSLVGWEKKNHNCTSKSRSWLKKIMLDFCPVLLRREDLSILHFLFPFNPVLKLFPLQKTHLKSYFLNLKKRSDL